MDPIAGPSAAYRPRLSIATGPSQHTMADASDTVRTESNGPLVAGVAVGFVSAAALFVAGRFCSRLVVLGFIGKDDWSILVATVFSVVTSVAACFEVKYGMGRHSEMVTPEETLQQLKFLMVAILHYNMGMNAVKLGFLFQYRRIFQGKLIHRICFWFIIYVCVWAVVQATLLALACLPISYIVPTMIGVCVDTLPIWYFSSTMSMATDFVIFCIPIPPVLKLQLPLRKRIMVLGIFSLGFFVCVISVYRIFTLRAAVESRDPSWENIGAAMWSCIELDVAIIVSSLPPIRTLVVRLMPCVRLSSIGNRRRRPTYLTRGSGSAAIRRRGSRSGGGRRLAAGSISTDELALGDLERSLNRSESGVYSHVSAAPRQGVHDRRLNQEGCIVRTTEIKVDSHAR